MRARNLDVSFPAARSTARPSLADPSRASDRRDHRTHSRHWWTVRRVHPKRPRPIRLKPGDAIPARGQGRLADAAPNVFEHTRCPAKLDRNKDILYYFILMTMWMETPSRARPACDHAPAVVRGAVLGAARWDIGLPAEIERPRR